MASKRAASDMPLVSRAHKQQRALLAPQVPAASDKAFGVAELLEQVLLSLDFRTLLFSQRVSRTWLSTIQSSLKLQKKLFFAPADVDEAWELNMIEADTIVQMELDGVATLYNTYAFDLLYEDQYDSDIGFAPLAFTPLPIDDDASWMRMRFAHDQYTESEIHPAKVQVQMHGKAIKRYDQSSVLNLHGSMKAKLSSLDSFASLLVDIQDRVHHGSGRRIDWQNSEIKFNLRSGYTMRYQDYLDAVASGDWERRFQKRTSKPKVCLVSGRAQ